ncbi:MAG: P-loop NTPase [Candidatus Dormibacteria bacterium]
MKVAVSGKGGTGKTSIAGTLARSFARRGHRVLAIDCDSNPNLATSLGLDPAVAEALEPLPTNAFARDPSVSELLTAFSATGPDGVRIVIGARVQEAGGGCTCGSHATVRGMLGEMLSSDAEITVVDMEAGLEHLSRAGGTLRYVDHLMVVVEPYVKAVETARRTLVLARDLGIKRISILGSKVREDTERELLARFCADEDVELIGVIPYDESARIADRDGVPAIERGPESPMVQAVNALAISLEESWSKAAVPA